MSIPEEARDVRAGLSFYVGRRLPGDVLAVAHAHGLRTGNWVFPPVSDDSVSGSQPAVERLAELGRSLRERATESGMTMLVPDDSGWPAGPGGDTVPCLWLRGTTDVAAVLSKAIAVTGSRACTPYGGHLAAEVAAEVADAGWTVVTTASLGIARHAIGGALTVADAAPVLLTACGLDQGFSQHLAGIVDHSAARGTVISAFPPGCQPMRSRAAVTDQLLYRLTAAAVLVEASLHGTTLRAAREAAQSGCDLWAVPGPVTSAMSAGCHQLIRDGAASLATSAKDVLHAVRDTSNRALMPFTIHATLRWDDNGPRMTELAPFEVWAGTVAHAANEALDVVLATHQGPASVDVIVQAPSGHREAIAIGLTGPVTAAV